MLGVLLQSPEAARRDLSSIVKLFYGGLPISEAVLGAALARLNCDIVQLYGMTESSATGTILDPNDYRRASAILRAAVADEGAVIDWVRARIAGYKTPKSVEALPRNATKVPRRVLRELSWAGRGQLVG